jgi:hypothetical protein
MQRPFALLMAGAALVFACGVLAQSFPDAPPDAAAAEKAGLQRIDGATLRSSYPGKRVARNLRGQIVHTELKPDGTLTYADDGGVTDTGTWSLSERNGGMLCRAYSKQMGRRFCTLYFAAPDGIHYFGYNPEDRLWRVTTRREE